MISVFTDDWVPFVCGTDVTVAVDATKVSIRTKGDGPWRKYTYQDIGFAITLSGLLTYENVDFSGWDFLDNQTNFLEILIRCTFIDDAGDTRTVQGKVLIENTTFSYSPGTLVKNDLQLTGNGKMDIFNGYVPCSSVVNTITVGGQTAADGIMHISYTYFGEVYQIKYRLDGTGDYVYALADEVLNIPGLAIGSDHSIEIIPVCSNGFEGTSLSTNFEVTQSQTCDGVITDIIINFLRAVAVFTGSATQMKYRINSGPWFVRTINSPVNLGVLAPGSYTIEMVPFCSNNVEGTGFVKAFDVTVQPGLGLVKLHGDIADFSIFDRTGGNKIQLYVNGVLTLLNPGSGITQSISAPNGAVIKGVVICKAGYTSELQTLNETLVTTLDDRVGGENSTIQFSFTVADGNTYRLNAQIVKVP